MRSVGSVRGCRPREGAEGVCSSAAACTPRAKHSESRCFVSDSCDRWRERIRCSKFWTSVDGASDSGATMQAVPRAISLALAWR